MKKNLLFLLLLLLLVPLVAKPSKPITKPTPQIFSCFYWGTSHQTPYNDGAYKYTTNITHSADVYVNRIYYSINAHYYDNQNDSTQLNYFGETAFVPDCSAMGNSPQYCRANNFSSPTNQDSACGTDTMSTYTSHGQERKWSAVLTNCDYTCANDGMEKEIKLEHLCRAL